MDAVNGMMNTKWWIRVSKDKWLNDFDVESRHWREDLTRSTNNGAWKEEEVDLQTLTEYIKKGYAIKINC